MAMEYPGVGCGLMLVRGGKVLLGLRNSDPEKADSMLKGEGTWTLPGGKLDMHETPMQCARREALEENGIRAGGMELVSVSNDTVPGAHFITLGFVCKDFDGEPQVLEPDEITEWKWFPFGSLPERIFPPSRKVMENYIGKRIYGDG